MSDDWTVENVYEEETPCEAVVRSVAAATDRSVVELDPLYEAIDPDALDALVGRDDGVTAKFRYEGCDVRITEERVTVVCAEDVRSSANT